VYNSRITALRNEQDLSHHLREDVSESCHCVMEEPRGPGNLAQKPFKGMSGSLGAERSLRRDIFTELCDTQSYIWTETHVMI